MILNLSGEMNNEMFNTLVGGLNDADGYLSIYLSSTGGETDIALAMVDLINRYAKAIDITFYGEVYSAGMFVFLKVNCKKNLLEDARGMFHFAYQDITINEGGKPSDPEDIFLMKEMKKVRARTLDYLKSTKLNEKEFNSIKKGNDVFFSYERMLELNG